jgi:hypothetical protein
MTHVFRSHKQLFLSDYLKKAKRRDKRVPEARLQAMPIEYQITAKYGLG